MSEKVKIFIEVDKNLAEEVKANVEEYLGDFYGPSSQNPQDFTVSIDDEEAREAGA